MTVKINLYFLLGFHSHHIQWTDSLVWWNLSKASSFFHQGNIHRTFQIERDLIYTQSNADIWGHTRFPWNCEKKLCVVHVIAVGFCKCRNEKRNSYLRPIAPIFPSSACVVVFFFFYIWPEYCYMHEILYFPLCVLSDENWVNIYTVLGRSVRKGNFGTLWMIYVKIIISNLEL